MCAAASSPSSAATGSTRGGHEVQELAAGEAERRPVEIVVGDEAVVLVAAAAGEPHPVDGGMRRPGQALDPAERRQRHVRLPARRTREGVAAGERVVHVEVVFGTADGEFTFRGPVGARADGR